MPKLPEYEATEKLQESDLGFSAHETAGRRIGPFYSEMAQATKEVANMQKENEDAIGQSLSSFMRFQAMEEKGGGGGANFKVEGGGKAERTLIGSGTNSGITHNYGDRNYSTLSDMSNGGKYLSQLARAAASKTASDQEKLLKNKEAWARYNQEVYDKHAKAGVYGGDPAKEMQDITKQVNDWPSLTPEEQQRYSAFPLDYGGTKDNPTPLDQQNVGNANPGMFGPDNRPTENLNNPPPDTPDTYDNSQPLSDDMGNNQ